MWSAHFLLWAIIMVHHILSGRALCRIPAIFVDLAASGLLGLIRLHSEPHRQYTISPNLLRRLGYKKFMSVQSGCNDDENVGCWI